MLNINNQLRAAASSACVVFFVVMPVFTSARAFPDGAPWGSADPNAAENCASCHYDNDVGMDSDAISFSFSSNSKKIPGKPRELYLQFRNPEGSKVGFQIIATAGRFESEWDDIETKGAQARSLEPRDNSSWPKIVGNNFTTNVVIWKLQWQPPLEPDGDVSFWIAINKSNDDQSVFGDEILFKTIRISMPGDFWLLPPL